MPEEKLAIIYSSVDGQTKKICERLKELIDLEGITTDLFSIHDCNYCLKNYNLIVIGSCVRYGKHSSEVYDYVVKNKNDLNSIKSAFFSVSLSASKKNKNNSTTNPYVKKFVQLVPWEPDLIEVFAGKLDFSKYSFVDRVMIKFILLISRGLINYNNPLEFTNWKKVNNFAKKLIIITRSN